MINDKYGHSAGDDVLRAVAVLLREEELNFRAVARIGGEEFSILIEADESTAAKLAESLRQRVADETFAEGLKITTSIGVATTRVSTEGMTLMEQSRQAMYAAKDQGRDSCMSFTQVVDQSRKSGQQVDVLSLENQARVLAQRVANVITMRSKSILDSARQEADVDGLTGCFTRRYLDRRLADEFANSNGAELCVAFFDLFGKVNKSYGWPTGDKVLVEVCSIVREIIREGDWIGRYGGEEFCVVMPEIGLPSAQQVMERILKAVETAEFFTVDGCPLKMTLSIGLASVTNHDAGPAALVNRACSHALVAKDNGRNQLCVD